MKYEPGDKIPMDTRLKVTRKEAPRYNQIGIVIHCLNMKAMVQLYFLDEKDEWFLYEEVSTV